MSSPVTDHRQHHATKNRAITIRGPERWMEGGRGKIRDDDKATIYNRYRAGETLRQIAADYGVTTGYIGKVVRGDA